MKKNVQTDRPTWKYFTSFSIIRNTGFLFKNYLIKATKVVDNIFLELVDSRYLHFMIILAVCTI